MGLVNLGLDDRNLQNALQNAEEKNVSILSIVYFFFFLSSLIVTTQDIHTNINWMVQSKRQLVAGEL